MVSLRSRSAAAIGGLSCLLYWVGIPTPSFQILSYGDLYGRGGPWKFTFTSRVTSMQNLDVMDVIHIRFTSMQKWLDFCSIFTSGVTSMQNLEVMGVI